MTGFKFSELGQINTGRSAIKFAGTAAPAGITWESVRGTETSTAFVDSSPVTSDPSVQWTFPIPGGADVSGEVVVGAEKIYIPTDAAVIAVDKESGASVWNTPISGESGPEIAADGDRVYLTDDDGLTALSTDDGSQEWTMSTGTGRDILSVKIHDGVVYGSGETLAVVNADDGSTIWAKNPIGEVDFGNFDASAGPMAVGEDRVYTQQFEDFGFSFGDVNIVAYDKDNGTRLWTRFTPPTPNEGNGGNNPCMLVNNILVVNYEEDSDSDFILEGLSPSDGSVLWTFDPNKTVLDGGYASIPGQDILMVRSGGPELHGVEISSGVQQWLNTDFLSEGLLQGAGIAAFEDTFIYPGQSRIVGIDPSNGSEKWTSSTGQGSDLVCSVGTGAIYTDKSSFETDIIKLDD